MALLADGLHMASHTVALGISAFAYYYARRHSEDESFSFGTGKVNALAGFSSAIMLIFFALMMAWESAYRFLNPVEIVFDQAIIVAIVGLIVNTISYFILVGHHSLEFSNQDFAKAFIKDGLKMAFNDRPVHFNEIQWLKLIAGKNNLPEDWFTQELENIDAKCIEEAK
jgi:cation diffusion facilitator family transporter